MEYKVIKEMLIRRVHKFDGKETKPINLYSIYYGVEGDDYFDKRPKIEVKIKETNYFIPLIGNLRGNQFPGIENIYNDDNFAFHVEDDKVKREVLKIIL